MITIYTAETIDNFSKEQLFSEDWLDELFSIDDEIARERALIYAEGHAGELGCDTEFKRLIKAYRRELARLKRDNERTASMQRQKIILERGARGEPLPTISNFLQVLNNDNRFDGIRFNTLTHSPEKEVGGKIVRWTDADDAATREYIERKYKIHSAPKLDDALRIVFSEREYNPAIDLIESIQWDGVPRIKTFLSKWMACEDSPYTREVSRLIFAGGIHRLYQPGCKFEDVPVLIGTRQGEGKSTLVRWLAMKDEFFREVTEIEGQKGMEAIEGAWICEMGELLALTRTKDVEAVKSFISRQSDHYRRPYDRRTSDYPRQCTFIGTTNKQQFLTDKTGNRRFYPVVVNQTGYQLFSQKEAVQKDIQQCWAEARALFCNGDLPPFLDPSLSDIAKEIQQQAAEDDYRIGMIESYLEGKTEVCAIELWVNALQNSFGKPQKKESNEISLIMQSIPGWVKLKKARRTNDFGVQKCWIRNENPTEEIELFL